MIERVNHVGAYVLLLGGKIDCVCMLLVLGWFSPSIVPNFFVSVGGWLVFFFFFLICLLLYCNNINEAIISNFWISYEKPFPPLSTLCLVIRVISFNNYHQKLWIMSRLSMGRLGSGICILDKPNRTTSKAKPNWTNFVWLGCPRFLTFSSHANWIQSPKKKKKIHWSTSISN